VRERHGSFFVQTHEHLGILVAEVVDDTIVETAIARPRYERRMLDLKAAQEFGDRVATPQRLTHP
jgi:hypothetical protein